MNKAKINVPSSIDVTSILYILSSIAHEAKSLGDDAVKKGHPAHLSTSYGVSAITAASSLLLKALVYQGSYSKLILDEDVKVVKDVFSAVKKNVPDAKSAASIIFRLSGQGIGFIISEVLNSIGDDDIVSLASLFSNKDSLIDKILDTLSSAPVKEGGDDSHDVNPSDMYEINGRIY